MWGGVWWFWSSRTPWSSMGFVRAVSSWDWVIFKDKSCNFSRQICSSTCSYSCSPLLFQLNFICCNLCVSSCSLGRVWLSFSLFLPSSVLADWKDVPVAPGRANPLLFVLLVFPCMICYHPRTSPLTLVQLSLDLLTLAFPLSMVLPETHFLLSAN